MQARRDSPQRGIPNQQKEATHATRQREDRHAPRSEPYTQPPLDPGAHHAYLRPNLLPGTEGEHGHTTAPRHYAARPWASTTALDPTAGAPPVPAAGPGAQSEQRGQSSRRGGAADEQPRLPRGAGHTAQRGTRPHLWGAERW